MLKGFKFAAALIVVMAIGFVAYVYSGLYDVSATSADGPAMRWLLGTVRRHSVATRLTDITVPPLSDPKMIEAGFDHYHEMCEGCHLAPGIESSEIHAGLNPSPPLLYRAVPHSTPAELFWVIKNGIKMTGMPAWGPTHDDTKIWQMVAFLETLPNTTPAQYRELVKNAKDVEMDDMPGMASKPDTH